MKCPKCGESQNIKTERRPNGDSECLNCNHKDKSSKFGFGSIDKMAEQFNSPEELQAYSEAQYKTILDLNSKLSNATEEIQKLRNENAKLKAEQSILKASQPVSAEDKYKVTDEESICIMQLALLKEHSLTRELIMDEVKRVEILCKTLSLIRGKADNKPKEKDTSKMTNEELMAWAEDSLKEKQ